MKILLDKIILDRTRRIQTLHLTDSLNRDASWIHDMYFDSDRPHFFVVESYIKGHTGDVSVHLIPAASVNAAIVCKESVPQHQGLATKPAYDTPSGQKRRFTPEAGKAELAKRIEARKNGEA